ncbi:cysteine metabolism transcriptional regulator CymR [Effusibacillus lacus]|uniref:Rrf2 family transcriptional regulator n=1 Tax=Effusibacillus lacus TaxID=1348429 RepID=A0A292YDL8_9BACL|nr:Rrf2 family transcriptional regulator [Effusibacillus lacus]TCS72030.1 BadM/Rrf2 family transcriptional regulator [Effusibacillus lacus]GAX90322.1 Rrf2 family transcriptional regulator [Effusibacillus lacus]
MKLSTKGRYGVTLMVDLAMYQGEGPISLKSIAEREDLSEHYLEQLIAPLRNAGLVRSIRGAYGGYVLAKSPQEITIGDIVRVLEGPITVVEDPEDDLNYIWEQVREAINKVLDSVTLADVAERKKSGGDNFMFYI